MIFAMALVAGLTVVSQGCGISIAKDADTVSQGQQARDFEAVGHDGEPLVMAELLAEGPVVMVFYRGYW